MGWVLEEKGDTFFNSRLWFALRTRDSIIPTISGEEKDEGSRQGIQSIEVGVPLPRMLADHLEVNFE